MMVPHFKFNCSKLQPAGKFFRVLLVTLLLSCRPGSDTAAQGLPDLIQSIRFDSPVRFCNRLIPIDRPDVKQQLEKEMLLALWDRPQVILWIKRSGKYFPHIEGILNRAQLCSDYKYVPVVESALRPHAGSSKGAVGFWQFLRSTGQRYGLTINSRVDERRNLFKSTQAAAEYLKSLKSKFGSDFLALAAYNMGEFSLENEIKAQQTNDFFSLYLPIETQRYVFKLIAVKLILENPSAYGFHFNPSDIYPVFAFDQAKFKTDAEIPLVLIARAAGTSFKQLKQMNPDIRGYYLARGDHTLLIPKGAAGNFNKQFHSGYQSWLAEKSPRIHVVQEGESLTGIARSYDISLKRLLQLNKFKMNEMIHPGDRLLVE